MFKATHIFNNVRDTWNLWDIHRSVLIWRVQDVHKYIQEIYICINLQRLYSQNLRSRKSAKSEWNCNIKSVRKISSVRPRCPEIRIRIKNLSPNLWSSKGTLLFIIISLNALYNSMISRLLLFDPSKGVEGYEHVFVPKFW